MTTHNEPRELKTDERVTDPTVVTPDALPIPMAPPGGAIQVDDWVTNDGQSRRFEGTKRGTDGVPTVSGHALHVDIVGWQSSDGAIERNIVIANDIHIDSACVVRELAANPLAAADEMEARAD